MTIRLPSLELLLAIALTITAGHADSVAAPRDPLAPAPTLQSTPNEQLRRELIAWLDTRQANRSIREQALARLPIETAAQASPAANPAPSGLDTVSALAEACAVADPRVAALVQTCSHPRSAAKLPDTTWLTTEELPQFLRNSLRLYYGRWLAQERLFDEALVQLDGLDARNVIEPATLLFYQAVVNHRLLHRDPGIKAIDRLLGEVVQPPARYKTLATLMRADLSTLEDDTLDHIARRMEDIRRRLDLGRGGKQTRQLEDGVIKSLDKLIEEMEKQQQQQQSASGGSISPSQPMQTPQLAPAQGPGKTDRRNIGNTSGWGDLPPKEREAALQQIGKDLPAHYRDVIEQYFRKLATEGGNTP
jgi:hypothetical protein